MGVFDTANSVMVKCGAAQWHSDGSASTINQSSMPSSCARDKSLKYWPWEAGSLWGERLQSLGWLRVRISSWGRQVKEDKIILLEEKTKGNLSRDDRGRGTLDYARGVARVWGIYGFEDSSSNRWFGIRCSMVDSSCEVEGGVRHKKYLWRTFGELCNIMRASADFRLLKASQDWVIVGRVGRLGVLGLRAVLVGKHEGVVETIDWGDYLVGMRRGGSCELITGRGNDFVWEKVWDIIFIRR